MRLQEITESVLREDAEYDVILRNLLKLSNFMMKKGQPFLRYHNKELNMELPHESIPSVISRLGTKAKYTVDTMGKSDPAKREAMEKAINDLISVGTQGNSKGVLSRQEIKPMADAIYAWSLDLQEKGLA